MKPRVNNPAWVQAIQDVMDLIDAAPTRPTRSTPTPARPASSSSLRAPVDADVVGRRGSSARTSDTSVVGDVVGFGINPGPTASTTPNRRMGRDG
jgi:multiple sugar transport system substrate-binding protein